MDKNKAKKKREFSKVICSALILIFTACCLSAILLSMLNCNTDAFMYIVPATGTTAAAAVSFYFYKAKAENLSKQRIRFVLMKLLLEEKLNGEAYQEILSEIENIDSTIDNKIKDMTTTSYNDDNTAL